MGKKKEIKVEKNPDGTISGELANYFDLQKEFWENTVYPFLDSKGIKFGKTEEEKKSTPAKPRFIDEKQAKKSLVSRLKKYKESKGIE